MRILAIAIYSKRRLSAKKIAVLRKFLLPRWDVFETFCVYLSQNTLAQKSPHEGVGTGATMKLRYLLATFFTFSLSAQATVFFDDDNTLGPVFVGATQSTGPFWNRPDEGEPPTTLSLTATAVPYSVKPFHVDLDGEYTFHSLAPGNWDNYTFLYQTSFDASDPLTNALIGNDDENGNKGVSSFTFTLSLGVEYFFVTTGGTNTSSGFFTNSITGPVIPEPGTAILVLGSLTIGGVIFMSQRKRTATVAV